MAERERRAANDRQMIDSLLAGMGVAKKLARRGVETQVDHLGFRRLRRPKAEMDVTTYGDTFQQWMVTTTGIDVRGMSDERTTLIMGLGILLADTERSLANLSAAVKSNREAREEERGRQERALTALRRENAVRESLIYELWAVMGRKSRARLDRNLAREVREIVDAIEETIEENRRDAAEDDDA